MSCFDCKNMHHKCKAECCGVFPISKELYEKNQHKIVRKPHDVIDADGHVIPCTVDSYCIFLNEDLYCNIYEDRPSVCRQFGDESHPMLCCPVLDKNGKERSRQNRRHIEKQTRNHMSKLGIIQ